MIDSLTTEWNPARYTDTYTDELRELIEAKAKGKDVTVEPDIEPEANPVIRLFKRLMPMTNEYHGQDFFVRETVGNRVRLVATPLAVVLVLLGPTGYDQLTRFRDAVLRYGRR